MDFVTHWTRIARQVKKLRSMQCKYSPGALQHLAIAGDVAESLEAENMPLLLPSALMTSESLPPLLAPEITASEVRLQV
jgi:hypothetical protein